MKKVAISSAVFVFFITVCVFPFTASAQSGGYVGIFGGYTFSPDASWKSGDFSRDIDIETTWAVGVKLGYTPPQVRWLSFELEYNYQNPDINRTVLDQSGANYVAVDGDIKFHSVMYNMTAKYPEGRVHPYLGAGIGASYADASVKTTSQLGGTTFIVSDSETNTAFAWQILAGLGIDIANNWTIDIGYRYFATNPKLGHAEIDYKTSMGTLGLNYRF